MKSGRKSYKPYPSIEVCPIWNFNKVTETGDPRYLFVMDDYYSLPEFTKPQKKKAHELWDKLFDEYLKSFGLSEHSFKILQWEVKIAKLKYEMIVESDWGMSAAIKIEESKMRTQVASENKSTFEETVAYLEQHRKISIDAFKCPTKMFYTYVNMMNGDAKKTKAKNLAKQK